uniref:FtsB family cell division protein n=1 Tax=Alistipes sp. TaxID=1872444 RepID=UPI004056C743
MKIGKKMGKQFEMTICKGREYAWRITLVAAVLLGIILIGRPLVSLIRTSIDIRKLNKEKAIYEESIRRDSLLIENLKSDEFLEQYAREKYFMQAKGEQVFIVED